jgi:CSLREA domain-containing protein
VPQGRARCLAAALTACAALAVGLPGSANAATITVDTADGGAASDGACSLREAILAANRDRRRDGCRRGDGADRIAFDIAGPAVIQPSQQLPDVTKPVAIDGTTEPNYAGVPVVNLDEGSLAVTGLETTGNRIVIKGLMVTDFTFEGLRIGGDRNRIVGNLIGINAAGAAHPNLTGVSLEGDGNVVGGRTDGARNLISGNDQSGVRSSGEDNRVTGNYVGTDAGGDDAVPNAFGGVVLNGPRNAAIDNVVSGNGGNGIGASTGGTESVIKGNLVGLEANGVEPLPNNGAGIGLTGARTTVGGAKPAGRNVISGNASEGIVIFNGFNGGLGRNRVVGNYIGTQADGLDDVANGSHGIRITTSRRNVIGGDDPGEGNVIAGNGAQGILIGLGSATANVVSGNVIGRGADLTTELPNANHGIRLDGTAPENVLGGTTKGAGNLIASNSLDGISIVDNSALGNAILRNSIFDNGEQPIDLREDGVTANDLGPPPDTDTGPNNLQNFPVLIGGDEQTDQLFGSLDSTPARRFRLEFFASETEDEAQRFVGATTVETDGSGHVEFSFQSRRNLPTGDFLTATATLLDGDLPTDTSELSDDADISAGP